MVTYMFHLLPTVGLFLIWSATDMLRSLFVISVNDGLAAGSGDQQSSISFFHSVSQRFGIGGLRVLLTIPPAHQIIKQFEQHNLR